jgi:uncharacterized protein (TIGR02466 family)
MSNKFNLNFQLAGLGPQPTAQPPAMTLYKLFPTVIWDAQLTQFEGNLGDWQRGVVALRAADPQSSRSSTWSGWSSQDRAILDSPAFKPLAAAITRLVNDALTQMAGEEVRFQLESWVNLHDRGGANQLHMHKHALLSGVFYLAVPERSGALYFRDPRPGVLHSPFSGEGPNACKIISLPPRAGSLVLFPHWLEHWVEPHDSDQPRISIAFNATGI